MRKVLIPIFCGLLSGALSCSKPQPPAPSATATPPSVNIPIDLGLTPTPGQSPTPEPLEYVLEDLKGTVLLREKGETLAQPAQEEETVEEGDEIITQADSEASLTLDENTMFHLAPNSDIKVDRLSPNASNGFVSRLLLLGGKVLSEVEKLGESHSTFEVESGGVVCGVRGTAFEVFNQGGAVHTLTYHGVVEMRKGALVQAVVAGHHSAFLAQKGTFQPPRLLRPAEQQRYQTWLRKKAVVQQRQAQRLAAIRSLSSLPPDQKKRVLENLKTAKPRDRMRLMHQMLQPKPAPGLNPAQTRQKGRPLSRPNRPQKRGGPQLPNKGVRSKSGTPHPFAPKPREKGQGFQKPGTLAQNFKNKGKNRKPLRPNFSQGQKRGIKPPAAQGQKPRPVLRPNRPNPNPGRPKIQPRKQGRPQPKGTNPDDKKKDKTKKKP